MPAFYFTQFPGSEQLHCPATLVFPGRTSFIEVGSRTNGFSKRVIAIACSLDDSQSDVFIFPSIVPPDEETAEEKQARFIAGLTPGNCIAELENNMQHAVELDPRYTGVARLIIDHHFVMAPNRLILCEQ